MGRGEGGHIVICGDDVVNGLSRRPLRDNVWSIPFRGSPETVIMNGVGTSGRGIRGLGTT